MSTEDTPAVEPRLHTLRLETRHPFMNDIVCSDFSIKVEDQFEQQGNEDYTYSIDLKFTPATGEHASPVLKFDFNSGTHEVKAADGLTAGIVYCDSSNSDEEPSRLGVLQNAGGFALLVTENSKPSWKSGGGGDVLFGVKGGAWNWGGIQECKE